MTSEAPLPLDFFKIQTVYARKMAEVAQLPFNQALLENTVCYKRIGIDDWEHKPNNPLWMKLVTKIKDGEDPAVVAYKMYMEEYAKYLRSGISKPCFSYHFDEADKTIHIHFSNNFATKESPLDPVNLAKRQEELKIIFGEIKDKYPEATNVEGYSWLYGYNSYKSLFPPEFIANLKIARPGVRGNGAWGQFLTHSGEINKKGADEFLSKVEKAKTTEEIGVAFPIPTYKTECEVKYFYRYFNTTLFHSPS